MMQPAVCEVDACGVAAIGRCATCRTAFCESHRSSWYRNICIVHERKEAQRRQHATEREAAAHQAKRKATKDWLLQVSSTKVYGTTLWKECLERDGRQLNTGQYLRVYTNHANGLLGRGKVKNRVFTITLTRTPLNIHVKIQSYDLEIVEIYDSGVVVWKNRSGGYAKFRTTKYKPSMPLPSDLARRVLEMIAT